MNDKAQTTLEYLLIFFITIIIFTTITMPLIIDTIKTTNDITETIQAQNTLNQITKDINTIYSSDYGSIKTRTINTTNKMRITYKNTNNRKLLTSKITLSDNTTKEITTEIPCKVSFNNNPGYYYKDINSNWLYTIETKWIIDTNGQKIININIKNYYR